MGGSWFLVLANYSSQKIESVEYTMKLINEFKQYKSMAESNNNLKL